MFIHAFSLPPELFTRPRQYANDSLFCVMTMMKAIRVRTQINHSDRRHRVKYGLDYFLDHFLDHFFGLFLDHFEGGKHTISTEGGVG